MLFTILIFWFFFFALNSTTASFLKSRIVLFYLLISFLLIFSLTKTNLPLEYFILSSPNINILFSTWFFHYLTVLLSLTVFVFIPLYYLSA